MTTEVSAQGFERKYLLTSSASTYGYALEALRNECAADRFSVQPTFTLYDGTSLVRPLTLAENAKALVNQYESTQDPEERTSILNSWRTTCTGIAYKARTTKFKIIPVCKELITLDQNFNKPYLPIPYNSFPTDELDSSQGIYDRGLTPEEFSASEFWKQGIPDPPVRTSFERIVYTERKGKPSLGIFIRSNTSQDELNVLFVNSLYNDSAPNGSGNLNYPSRFVRVVQDAEGTAGKKTAPQELSSPNPSLEEYLLCSLARAYIRNIEK